MNKRNKLKKGDDHQIRGRKRKERERDREVGSLLGKN